MNEVLDQIQEQLASGNYGGIVVIVDNLDRVERLSTTGVNLQERLFVQNAETLIGLHCHTIYVVPQALIHSPQGVKLVDIYGANPRVLPMIPCTNREGEKQPEGLQMLREAIERRCRVSGADILTVFDTEETIQRLCEMSGGYIRRLMGLCQIAVRKTKELPVKGAAVEEAIRDIRDINLLGFTKDEQWKILQEVATSRDVLQKEGSPVEVILELLDVVAILEYRDIKGPWYDVAPILKEAEEFSSTSSPE